MLALATKQPVSQRYLGESVFCLMPDGKLTRTVVSGLGDNDALLGASEGTDHYRLLNGKSRIEHFFDIDEAIAASRKAVTKLLESGDVTPNDAREMEHYLARLELDDYKRQLVASALMEAPMMLGALPARVLGSDEKFPTVYFKPGEMVYGVVTPKTHYMYTDQWRPLPYFVLQTTVRSVIYSPRWPGNVYYSLLSKYTLTHNHLFPSLEEARSALTTLFSAETGGTIEPENIQCFSSEVELAAEKEMIARVRAVMFK